MKGKYRVIIDNNRLRYDFVICRNITVIRGDSATGKTQMISLLEERQRNGDSSGVDVFCDRPCVVVYQDDWEDRIMRLHESIIFIEEGNRFVSSYDFARDMAKTDNYYVIVTREPLFNLPYSVEEVYGIRTSGKYRGLKKTYNEFYRLYSDLSSDTEQTVSTVITEDSNAGHAFWKKTVGDSITCITAGGKTAMPAALQDCKDACTAIIADGAAFGPEMERIMRQIRAGRKVLLYLPESFEWILLGAELWEDREVRDILQEPSKYIESGEYVSWERFFTSLLVEKSRGTWLQYSKQKLNPSYLQPGIVKKIRQSLPDPIRNLMASEDSPEKDSRK